MLISALYTERVSPSLVHSHNNTARNDPYDAANDSVCFKGSHDSVSFFWLKNKKRDNFRSIMNGQSDIISVILSIKQRLFF